MKKIISMILALAMVLALAGCAGTTVVVNNYYGTDSTAPAETEATEPIVAEGAVRTGLAIVTGLTSTDATAEAEGNANFDIMLAAILVDENDIILDCAIDAIGHEFTFDTTGAITSDLTAEVLTKNELGFDYGMVSIAHATYEWFEQAANFASYITGKTADEVAGIAIDEATKPADADLATSVTISIYGFKALIAKALGQ